MTFFLIVPSVIIVSIIAIHGITNFLGLEIKYGTLFMCAALAFLSLFVALEMSPNPDELFYLRLGAMILPSAAIVTALNRFLILRGKDTEAAFTEEVRREYSRQVEKETLTEVKPSTVAKNFTDVKIFSADDKKTSDKAKETADNDKPNLTDKRISTKDKNVSSEKIFELPKFKKVNLEKSSAPIKNTDSGEKISKSAKIIQLKPKQAENFEKVLQAAQVESSLAAKNSNGDEEDFETLESLVKYAKAEKVKGNFTAAIDAYQKALDDYGDDDYAPFVAIDLSAIYREQAAYTKAIKVYEDALELPIVKKNPAVKEEFQKKLDYIQTVKAVLLRHRALSTPFSKIPIEYMQEIESEFNENLDM